MHRSIASAAGLVLAAIATIAVGPAPVEAFKAGKLIVEGLETTADTVGEVERRAKAASEGKSAAQIELQERIRKYQGAATDKAAKAVEKGVAKGGRKLWNALEKSKKFGKTALKMAKRWGPAAKRGLRLAGPVGRVVDAWDAGTAVGTAIYKYGVGPMIDAHFERKGREQQERHEREIEEIRKNAELRRNVAAQMAAQDKLARELDEEKRRLEGPDRSAADDDWGRLPAAAAPAPKPRAGGLAGNVGGSSNLMRALDVLDKVATDPNVAGYAGGERRTTAPSPRPEPRAAERPAQRRQNVDRGRAAPPETPGRATPFGPLPAGCGSPACNRAWEAAGPRIERLAAPVISGGLSLSQMERHNREMYRIMLGALEICLADETEPECRQQYRQLHGIMQRAHGSME